MSEQIESGRVGSGVVRRARRALQAAMLLSLSVALSACSIFGGSSSLPTVMPTDFEFVHTVSNATQPAVDYSIAVKRAGTFAYEATGRAPRRWSRSDTREVTEDYLQNLYATLISSEFAGLPDYLMAESGTERTDVGDRVYFVRADGFEKRVHAQFTDMPELARIRQALFAKGAPVVTRPPDRGETRPADRFVAEEVERKFHREDCPVLKSITQGRTVFDSMYDALNFSYDPCEVCKPMGRP